MRIALLLYLCLSCMGKEIASSRNSNEPLKEYYVWTETELSFEEMVWRMAMGISDDPIYRLIRVNPLTHTTEPAD